MAILTVLLLIATLLGLSTTAVGNPKKRDKEETTFLRRRERESSGRHGYIVQGTSKQRSGRGKPYDPENIRKVLFHPICVAAIIAIIMGLVVAFFIAGWVIASLMAITSFCAWIFGYNWAKRH